MPSTQRHAVVVGGSLAGLLAARVLSETYERVTVLDRDTWADRPQPRGGVPQSRHAHAVLARGREVLEELFPGFTADAVALGAPLVDMHAQVRWYAEGRSLAQQASDLLGLGASRPLLEWLVRDRVRRLPRVELRPGQRVHDLVGPWSGAVTGVRTEGADGPYLLDADLVVDASGRTSQAPRWLEGLGHDAPAEDVVRVDVAYATRYFRRRPDDLDGSTLAMPFAASPAQPRGGVLIAQEGDRWVLGLNGYHGARPPTDLDDFARWADGLSPELGELARTAEPLDDGARYRFPASIRRRYERLDRLPAGLLVVGDALCSFNPSYGQGQTVAAVEAAVLRDCLAEGTDGLGRRFFAAAAPIVDVPWQIAVGGDLALPGTQAPRPLAGRVLGRYVRRVRRVGAHDPGVAAAFLAVANLTAAPQSLLAPAVARRVLGRRLPPDPAPIAHNSVHVHQPVR